MAGHPALDFLNTVKYRGTADPGDRLAAFRDIVDWARIAGLISHAETTRLAKHNPDGSETVRLHREICNFREKLRLLFIPPAKNDSDYLAAVASVELAISRLRPLARIDRENLALTWATPVEIGRAHV